MLLFFEPAPVLLSLVIRCLDREMCIQLSWRLRGRSPGRSPAVPQQPPVPGRGMPRMPSAFSPALTIPLGTPICSLPLPWLCFGGDTAPEEPSPSSPAQSPLAHGTGSALCLRHRLGSRWHLLGTPWGPRHAHSARPVPITNRGRQLKISCPSPPVHLQKMVKQRRGRGRHSPRKACAFPVDCESLSPSIHF